MRAVVVYSRLSCLQQTTDPQSNHKIQGVELTCFLFQCLLFLFSGLNTCKVKKKRVFSHILSGQLDAFIVGALWMIKKQCVQVAFIPPMCINSSPFWFSKAKWKEWVVCRGVLFGMIEWLVRLWQALRCLYVQKSAQQEDCIVQCARMKVISWTKLELRCVCRNYTVLDAKRIKWWEWLYWWVLLKSLTRMLQCPFMITIACLMKTWHMPQISLLIVTMRKKV